MNSKKLIFTAVVVANVIALSVLGFHKTSQATQKRVQQPFANSVEQRQSMIRELQAIRTLLQEQNTLLKQSFGAPKPNAQKKPTLRQR